MTSFRSLIEERKIGRPPTLKKNTFDIASNIKRKPKSTVFNSRTGSGHGKDLKIGTASTGSGGSAGGSASSSSTGVVRRAQGGVGGGNKLKLPE